MRKPPSPRRRSIASAMSAVNVAMPQPYNIRERFFQAHIGWLLFKLKPPPPFDNVIDLQKNPLIMWQHRYVQ